MIRFLVLVFVLCVSIFGSFKFPLVILKFYPIFLALGIAFAIYIFYCDWFVFPFFFLGDVFTDLGIFRLLSLNFSATVVRSTICSCSGEIVFQFPKVSRISYLMIADFIGCYDVVSSLSL